MVRVLVVDDAPLTLTNIERLLGNAEGLESCGTAQDGATALSLAQQLRPDIVLIDMDLQHGEGLQTTQTITQQYPETKVIVMGLDDDEATRKIVADAGASTYLVKPFGGSELLAILRQVGGISAAPPRPAAPAAPPAAAAAPNMPNPYANPAPAAPAAAAPAPAPFGAAPPAPFGGPPPAPVPPPTMAPSQVPLAGGMQVPSQPAPPAAAAVGAAQAPPGSKVIALISGKGGVGTSVLTTNLALLAANEARRRVGVIDFDIQHGDLRRMLRIDAPEGIVDLARVSPGVDRDALASRLVPGPGGIQALLSPPRPVLDVQLPPEFVAALLLQMRFLVQDVLIDMSPHITQASIAALRSADHIVLVSNMSDPGVRATQGMLRLFNEIGIPSSQIVVLLNRTEANSDLTKPAIEEAIGRSVPVQLPYDPILVSTSINRGAPFVLQKPDAQASRKLREVAALFFPMPMSTDSSAPAPAPVYEDDRRDTKKKGLFSRR